MELQGILILCLVLGFLPEHITALDAIEGEVVTLTCPRRSRSKSRPVVWEGPPDFTHYTRGLDVSLLLPGDVRSRISTVGDHSIGYYNLQISDIRKSDSGIYRCLIGTRMQRQIRVQVKSQEEQTQGLFPYILNLATRSVISSNATCGMDRPEYFCKLVEHVDLLPRVSHCDYCNARAGRNRPGELGKPHPVTNAIDGSNKWWQSPSISNGREYNYVTITLDLGLIYQVAYVVIKAANAPRPGNWVLEKSVDGVDYEPWQYFAITDEDCERLFSMEATPGKPSYDYLRDDEVRCTSYYSKLNPLENGEIFVSLTNGRPGIYVPSKALLEFTSARFVRLRLLKIRTLNADLMSLQSRDPRNLDPSVTRRYFYSIKDISIGGQCICYGHAQECQRQGTSDSLACLCEHNTCGSNCEVCCPLFNQKPWVRGNGNSNGNIQCEACNCHDHADECVYNATVDALGLSLNMQGEYSGGGVCLECNEYTDGINCEKCLPGYFRPYGVAHTSRQPCRPCNCAKSVGSTGICVLDDAKIDLGLRPGDCLCKEGYSGPNCDKCDLGYFGYPNCEPCPCNMAGSVDPSVCEGRCNCKPNVDGVYCEQCRAGHYDLSAENPLGCRTCFCFGITTDCQRANLGLVQISDMSGDMDGWTVITHNEEGFTLFPTVSGDWLEYTTFPVRDQNSLAKEYSVRDEVIYYWQAPIKYYGSRLTSYGGKLHYTIKFEVDETAPWQYHLAEADVILQGDNITVTNGRNYLREVQENKMSLILEESNWFRLDKTGQRISQTPVTRREFMTLLYDLQRILIRATHHTAQHRVLLKDVKLEAVSAGSDNDETISGVEKCACPRGYSGLSCESCDAGWRRVDNVLYGGTCVPCDCNGHSKTCDPYTGRCLACTDNTEGDRCQRCTAGFYGDPSFGTPEDCQPCACPLTLTTNNFASECVLQPKFGDPDHFVCLDCNPGYAGERCERCAEGYYGYPGLAGNYCQPCFCNGNIDRNTPGSCDTLTGRCQVCTHNTEGDDCERCQVGYYGTAVNGDCKMCECDPMGSVNGSCDGSMGQCECKEHYTGRRCDRCEGGFGNVMLGCLPCQCSRIGSLDHRCHPKTGQCICRPGVTGLSCDECQDGFYGYSHGGCRDCGCYRPGSNRTEICDIKTGVCNCLENVAGDSCDSCQVDHWGLELGKGCLPCQCDPNGSYFDQCDSMTGQCRCKPGVTGQQCDQCQEGYYGLASKGECLECEPCDLPGHICDQDTGACVCPPNTEGDSCERCVDTYWGYHPTQGCKPCACNLNGSLDDMCDPLTGQCVCKLDYQGLHCDMCLFGFYRFPECNLCLCSVEGTSKDSCDPLGACSCEDSDGQCSCKTNTVSRTCSQCAPDSFSLDETNPDGCTSCFCFDRSQTCSQAQYVWTQVNHPNRTITFDGRSDTTVAKQQHGFYVVPDVGSWTGLPSNVDNEAMYWRLPNVTGDLTTSYGGELTFSVRHGAVGGVVTDLEGLSDSPLVILVGHGFPLMFKSDVMWKSDQETAFKVPLHHSYWRTRQNGEVSRRTLMIILQNVTEILVRATWDMSATYAELGAIKLDVAVPNTETLGVPALGIEQCDCGDQYSGLSCQNPAAGYYRVPSVGPIDFTDLIGVIGEVEECSCFQHSDQCDPETGICLDCEHNTAGKNCDECAPGYYGDPTVGTPADCQRCACPLEVTTNNFSPTCEMISGDMVCTACEEGYEGDRCEFCMEGYYGDPSTPGSKCMPCGCNLQGSIDLQCDESGQCPCLPGILGLKCDQCQARYAVVEGSCVSCDEGCTRTLMSDLDELEDMTNSLPFDPSNPNITLPVGRLRQVQNHTEELRKSLDNLKLAAVRDMKKQVDKVMEDAVLVKTRALGAVAKSQFNQNNGEDLLQNATDIEALVNKLGQEIRDLVDGFESSVENTFHNRSGLNSTKAFLEAEEILKEIRARDFEDSEERAREEDRLAEALSDRVLDMHKLLVNTTEVEAGLSDVLDRLQDLENKTETSSDKAQTTSDKLQTLRAIVMDLKQRVNETKQMNKAIPKLLAEAEELIGDGQDALLRAAENGRVLEKEASTLDNAMVYLEEKEEKVRVSAPRSEELTETAWAHAQNLTDYAERLEEMFEGTRSAAADPLKAANVYEDIVKAIEEAEKAAKKAISDVDNATSIANVDELKDQVDETLAKSQELIDKARDTEDDVLNLGDELDAQNAALDKVEDRHIDAVSTHQDVTQEFNNLPRDTLDRVADVQDSLYTTELKLAQTDVTVDEIDEKIDQVMMPKLKELQDLHADKYDDVKNKLAGVNKDLEAMRNLSAVFDERYGKSKKLNSDLGDKLKKLKQSIREAREEANKVKTSLMSEGKCVKQFKSVSIPGIISTISFAFKTASPSQDMLIVLIQNQEVTEGDADREFLSVELIGGKIRFNWNAGGGTASITHDQVIQPENQIFKESDKWYRVTAQRIGRLGRLTVHPVAEEAGSPQSTSSVVGFSVMSLGEDTDFYVAGVPEGYEVPRGVVSSNFTGCVGDLYIDDQLVGLSNFLTNTQTTCKACREVPSLEPGANIYTFTGTGYAVTDKVKLTNPISSNIVVEFRTIWENATLFFVGNSSTGEFQSLELQNGHLVYQFNVGEGSVAALISKNVYNKNSWVEVAAGRHGTYGILKIDTNTEKLMVKAPDGDHVARFKGNDAYFGGIPDDVDVELYADASGLIVQSTKFLGCMKNIQVSLENVNLWEGKTTVGVTEGCKDSGLRNIGFYGEGFAEYAGTSLDTDEADLSVSFSTVKTEALLLLAKNINGDKFYSLCVFRGYVEGKFSGGGSPVTLTTLEKYNDGKVHNVAVKKTGRSLEIYIDDKVVADGKLPAGSDSIQVREDGGLYIGGVPRNIRVEGMAATKQSLDGCISDIVINGNVLNINLPQQYERADVGRCSRQTVMAAADEEEDDMGPAPGPVVVTTEATPSGSTKKDEKKLETSPLEIREMTADMAVTDSVTQAPDSCAANVLLYDYEGEAYTFGEEKTSFQTINITMRELKKSFKISLEFRTFYRDGVLFYMTNKAGTSFMVAQLRRNKVEITYEHKKKVKTIRADIAKRFGDGNWHTVLVEKTMKLVTLTVDGVGRVTGSVAKKLRTEEPLYVGGFPVTAPVYEKLVNHSLRGCMRNLVVNDDLKDVDDVTLISGVDRCFMKVEEGVHFTGNSYAAYETKFEVGQLLDISLEFRTPKPDGILLTVSNSDGKQAMSLQLHEGQVKLTLKNAGGELLAQTRFNNPFMLCDQRWHRIKANVIKNVISVQVDDNAPETTPSAEDIRNTRTTAPLYIGGFPVQSAQGAALTERGFEGCMRDVRIRESQVDWFNVPLAVDLYKTACPVT